MASFPNLQSGNPVLHPAGRGTVYNTRVVQFENGSEQRWQGAPTRKRWTLTYQGIDGYDVSLIRAFFRSVKGRFDSTWDITVDAVLYENMVFEEDGLRVSETEDGKHDVSISAVQVQ